MTILESLVSRLATYDIRSYEDCPRFQDTLSEIGELYDPRCIALLITFLEDGDEIVTENRQSLIRMIEIFDGETYVKGVLDSLPGSWKKSPNCVGEIHHRILNSPVTLHAYKEELTKRDRATLNSVIEIFDCITEESPEFSQRCNDLLADVLRS